MQFMSLNKYEALNFFCELLIIQIFCIPEAERQIPSDMLWLE